MTIKLNIAKPTKLQFISIEAEVGTVLVKVVLGIDMGVTVVNVVGGAPVVVGGAVVGSVTKTCSV